MDPRQKLYDRNMVQMTRRCWLWLCVLVVAPMYSVAAFGGDAPLSDPNAPDGELAVYKIDQGGEVWEFTELTRIGERSGVPVYKFVHVEPNEQIEVTVEKRTMLPVAVKSVATGPTMTRESSTQINLNRYPVSEGILVLSSTELKYLLRGYPFDLAPTLYVELLNPDDEEQSSIDFSIRVRYGGLESVEIAGRRFEAHRLELRMSARGILRVMNALVPKTYFWYSVESPHYLVAYEGSSGFPGSPKQRIEILEYSGW